LCGLNFWQVEKQWKSQFSSEERPSWATNKRGGRRKRKLPSIKNRKTLNKKEPSLPQGDAKKELIKKRVVGGGGGALAIGKEAGSLNPNRKKRICLTITNGGEE